MNLPTGADKRLEADDPLELVKVAYPVAAEKDADATLARCFVEEYALTGWSAARIRGLFTCPDYGAPYGIASRRGMELVDAIIADVFGGEER